MEFAELIESVKSDEASVQKLFGGDGQGIRGLKRSPKYKESLVKAVEFVADIYTGKKSFDRFKEAMTTSDFPYLFGDILDRQLLAAYQETSPVFRNYCRIATVSDFRTVNRFTVDGAESVLPVVQQQEEYPESSLSEGRYQYSVKKYGRRIPFAWETMVNDDLDALKDIPARFGRAARRSEQKFATGLYVDANGPHASFYTGGNSNIVTGNPALSISGLQTAMTVLSAQVDADGEPIMIDAVHLVVPPALEITAKNILNATELRLNTSGGASNAQLITGNWMKNSVQLSVDPYIPKIAVTSNTNTSWFLFASPSNNRPALEVGFLRGHLTPEIFIKSPNSMMVGGGSADFMMGDFDTDSIQYKVRHVFGGTRIDPKMTVASNGSGS